MIRLSDAAADQILKLMTDAGDLGLRLEVISGGCSGFQYKFTKVTEENEEDGDVLIQADDGEALMHMDPASAEKIDGSTIDFKADLMSQEFVVINPNSNVCGCGKSFT